MASYSPAPTDEQVLRGVKWKPEGKQLTGVHETEKRNIFAQWRVSHCGKHDRLRDLRLTERRADVQWLIWVVFGSVDSWWDLLCVRGALLC